MSFISLAFLVFFVVVATLNALLAGRARTFVLLGASYIFYGWWDWRFLSLIFVSSLIDFVAAGGIERARQRSTRANAGKPWLMVSLVANLGLLATFKYYGFFMESVVHGLALLGISASPHVLSIVLPVGISFYTFQTMSYTLDVYRGEIRAARRLDAFLLFVSFFPQLVAGPIERAKHLLPQIERLPRPTPAGVSSGLELMLAGFVMKMVVADNMAPYVNSVFHNPSAGGAAVATASVAFALQIYGDFAGYSMIACGSARVLGFDIMANFRNPYISRTPSEFWQRWHISLSSWLRDYLYISIGGNRGGKFRTYRNLAITMLLGGLWHGASWTFVIWGAFHGALLIVFRAFGDRTPTPLIPARINARGAIGVVGFFALTCYGWLIFRAESAAQLATFTLSLFTRWDHGSVAWPQLARLFVLALPMIAYDFACIRSGSLEPWTKLATPARVALALLAFYSIVLWGTPYAAEFIYFQF